jgi:hypothetical protein
MTLMSLAEFARRVGKSRAAITQWKKAGRLVLQGDQVDVEATDERLKRYRREGMPAVVTDDPAVKRGRPSVKYGPESVKQSDQLNTDPVCLTCADVLERLERLDWTQTFDWSAEAQRERARLAAQCVGWEAVESDVRDDGHWGGFQLRITGAGPGLREDAIAGGFGFELSAFEVLQLCRAETEACRWPDTQALMFDDEDVTVRLDLLPLLARPFHEHDKQP